MTLPDDVRALLGAPNIAHIATVLPDGAPHAVPVWIGMEGDRIAFLGSDNESASGWRGHHETFAVYRSWHSETWSEFGVPIVDQFERHWRGSPGGGWAVVDLPDAVRDHLVSLAKHEAPPPRDPVERVPETPPSEDPRLRFVAVAPRIGGGTGGSLRIASFAYQVLTGVNTYTGATTIEGNAALGLQDNGSIALSSSLNLTGANAMTVQMFDATDQDNRHIHLKGLTPGAWQTVYLDFTADAKRNDGKDTPFAAGHKVDDIFFFVQPGGAEAVNLLVDEVVLYDAGKR